jgi:hypothetical protein
VVNALPAEKRKGYLFQPSTMLTYQTLIDRILEADGITKEMIEAQQKRVNLIQRLLSVTNPEDRITIIHQEESTIDGNMFAILSTLLQSASMQGDENSVKFLGQIQNEMLKETEVGQKLLADSQETKRALQELEEAQKAGLTREKLLDILFSVKSENSLAAIVSFARAGMDYQFFQVLSERIDKAESEQKQKLVELRDHLLSLTREIDLEMKKHLEDANKLLETILNDEKLEESIEKHIPEIDDFFSHAVQLAFEKAREDNDLPRIEKIQKVISVIEKMTAPPPEIEFLQTLLEAPDEASRRKLLEENTDKVNDQFLTTINSIISESESRKQSPELTTVLQDIYKLALRVSMEKNLKG